MLLLFLVVAETCWASSSPPNGVAQTGADAAAGAGPRAGAAYDLFAAYPASAIYNKRLPAQYNFGLGKRASKLYSFGLGKRAADDDETEDSLSDEQLDSLMDKRARDYSFGLGKRARDYSFGLGKRARDYSFGLGKRARDYSFGLGKRARDYSFGLGKRGANGDQRLYSFGLGKRLPAGERRYAFGLGKRSQDADFDEQPVESDDAEWGVLDKLEEVAAEEQTDEQHGPRAKRAAPSEHDAEVMELEDLADDDDDMTRAGRAGKYEFGLGKRGRSYEFGLGKRGRSYEFGLGKRGRSYEFGLGKRGRSYEFGLGKRGRSYEFGLGKRSQGAPIPQLYRQYDAPSAKRGPRQYGFGLGRRMPGKEALMRLAAFVGIMRLEGSLRLVCSPYLRPSYDQFAHMLDAQNSFRLLARPSPLLDGRGGGGGVGHTALLHM